MFPAGPPWRPRRLPFLQGGMPSGQQGPERIIQHRHRENAEIVLAAGLWLRHVRAVFPQNLAGGCEQRVQAGESFAQQTVIRAERHNGDARHEFHVQLPRGLALVVVRFPGTTDLQEGQVEADLDALWPANPYHHTPPTVHPNVPHGGVSGQRPGRWPGRGHARWAPRPCSVRPPQSRSLPVDEFLIGTMPRSALLWDGAKWKSTFADLGPRVAGTAVAGRPARCRGRAERGGSAWENTGYATP